MNSDLHMTPLFFGRVDLVVGHSMGCFMAMALKTSWESIKKLALICPLPGNWAPRYLMMMVMIELYNKNPYLTIIIIAIIIIIIILILIIIITTIIILLISLIIIITTIIILLISLIYY